MYQTVLVEVKPSHKLFSYCDNLTHLYKNLYNTTNFYIRQCMTGIKKSPETRCHNEIEVLHHVFQHMGKQFSYPTEKNWCLNYYQLDSIFKNSENSCYRSLPAQVNQNVIKDCVLSWKSYFASIKDYKKHPKKYTGKPKLPKYKQSEHMTATFTNINCKVSVNKKNQKSYVRFPKTKTKVCLGKLETDSQLKEVTIQPYQDRYRIAVVLEIAEPEIQTKFKETAILGIDLGLENLVTTSNNIGVTPIIIKGKCLKARNQWYNHQLAKLNHELMKSGLTTSKRKQRLTRHRNNYIKDYCYKTVNHLIAYCEEYQIGQMVVGYNKQWKTGIQLGKKKNQQFVQIPFLTLLNILSYQCKRHGIQLLLQEESYTSKASFLDQDELPVYGDKIAKKPVFKGKRISRGLYQSATGLIFNADINGASNIIRKQNSKAFDLIRDFRYLEQVNILNYEEINRKVA